MAGSSAVWQGVNLLGNMHEILLQTPRDYSMDSTGQEPWALALPLERACRVTLGKSLLSEPVFLHLGLDQ